MNHIEKTFGEKLPNIKYIERVGAYAIIFGQENKIPVVKTPTGYFLIGGGIEENESHEECIVRECLEETGMLIKVEDFICKGGKYHWSDTLKYYMHGIGYFYYAKVIENHSDPIETDHVLVWLDINECINKLFLEHQAWAVKQAVERRRLAK